MSSRVFIEVVAGQKNEVVGRTEAREGMATNKGVISRTTEGGQVVTDQGRFRKTEHIKVTLTTARRFGYPDNLNDTEYQHIEPRRRQLATA